jgi:hypothetical protein
MPQELPSELEALVSELQAEIEKTKSIMDQLENKQYEASIPSILFDYFIFLKIMGGDFDERLKERCMTYISVAEGLRQEVDKTTSLKTLPKKTSTSARHRLAIALGKSTLKEILARLKEEDTKELVRCDEQSELYTFTSLALIRYRIQRSLLYTFCPHLRGKTAYFEENTLEGDSS